MCRCVDQSITMSVHRGAGCMYVCTNYTIINISFLRFLPPQTIAVYYLLMYSLAPFTNVHTSARALPVFMPCPEIIYINTPNSLPRHEVVYVHSRVPFQPVPPCHGTGYFFSLEVSKVLKVSYWSRFHNQKSRSGTGLFGAFAYTG